MPWVIDIQYDGSLLPPQAVLWFEGGSVFDTQQSAENFVADNPAPAGTTYTIVPTDFTTDTRTYP